MRVNDEMLALFRHELHSFSQRAIARELYDLMQDPKTPGECPLSVDEWSENWLVSSEDIWMVIDFMTERGLWQVEHGRFQDTLKSAQIKSASSILRKKGKRLDMKQIRKAAQADRSSDLGLADVLPSAVSEICRKIPLLERNTALQEGYAGWLPSDRYGLDGTVYVINQGMIDQWQDEFQDVDIGRALTLMFDDLKLERMERPKPATFPYWVKNWLKKHGESVVSNDDVISVNTDFEVDY